MSLTPAQIKPKSSELRWNSFFFTQGGCTSCLRGCLGAKLLPLSYQYPNLLEGTDRIHGQLCRDNECPFSGITKSGRVWRKIPESNAQSVPLPDVLFLWHVTYSSFVHRSMSVNPIAKKKQASTSSIEDQLR